MNEKYVGGVSGPLPRPEPKPRKAVQIAVLETDQVDNCFGYLYALADDGTIWGHALGADDSVEWERMTALPQGPVAGGGE